MLLFRRHCVCSFASLLHLKNHGDLLTQPDTDYVLQTQLEELDLILAQIWPFAAYAIGWCIIGIVNTPLYMLCFHPRYFDSNIITLI
jgi:hypothetical protein